MSKHGKRRRPRGSDPPEQPIRYPPRISEEDRYWEELRRPDPVEEEAPAEPPRAQPEWYRGEPSWDQSGRYGDHTHPWETPERYAPWEPAPEPAPEPGPEPAAEPEAEADHLLEAPPPARRSRRAQPAKKAKQAKQAKRAKQINKEKKKKGRQRRERRPDPPPLETNDVRVIAIGTVVWGLAFGGLYLVRDRLEEEGYGWVLWSCLAGFGLGLLGVWYVKRRRDSLATQNRRRDRAPAAPEPEPVPEPVPEPGHRPDPEPGDDETRLWSAEQSWPAEDYDEITPVTGEIVFEDPPRRYSSESRSYRPVEPPPFRPPQQRPAPPEEGYGRGWREG